MFNFVQIILICTDNLRANRLKLTAHMLPNKQAHNTRDQESEQQTPWFLCTVAEWLTLRPGMVVCLCQFLSSPEINCLLSGVHPA